MLPAAAIALALSIANHHWPDSPCRDKQIVTWVQQKELDADHPDHEAGWISGDADITGRTCNVRFSTDTLDPWSMTYADFCSLAMHEYGHLAGRAHSHDKLDVMAPVVPTMRKCALAFKPPVCHERNWKCRVRRIKGDPMSYEFVASNGLRRMIRDPL